MASLNLDKGKDVYGEGQEKADISNGDPLTLTREREELAPSSGKELKKPSAEQLETHVSCASTNHIHVSVRAECLIPSLFFLLLYNV